MHWNVFSKDFVSFLLAVAGSFPDIHICDTEEWAGASKSSSYRSFYKRTDIFRKDFFAVRNPELGTAAKSGYDTICSDDYFIRYIYAEGSEYLASFFLLFNEFGRADTVHLSDDHIPEVHCLRTVFLCHKYIPNCCRKNLTEIVMIFDIHPKVFPHFFIISHFHFLLLYNDDLLVSIYFVAIHIKYCTK